MMNHQEVQEKIPLYVAGELPAVEVAELEAHLESCESCRHELEEFRKMEEMLAPLRLPDPPDELWDGYWSGIYNRMERRLGWMLFSLGAIVLLFFGFYRLVEGMLADPTVPPLIKWGVLFIGGGLAILLVSVIREQLFHRKNERYREVRR
ncbi:MAG: hypothetical protein GXO70_04235 [Acidobacteria bacterium]|nr:hypothetical protein [Acidobacteriota bacterium]